MNRKPILLLLALLVASTALMAQTQQQRLEKHLYYLASDSLQGRKAGSDDGRKAAAYIENEYLQMGLQPFGGTYRHYFLHSYSSIRGRSVPVSADSVDYYAAQDKTVYCNLVGIIEGSDPVLKNEYIVVGGHYDAAATSSAASSSVPSMPRNWVSSAPKPSLWKCSSWA